MTPLRFRLAWLGLAFFTLVMAACADGKAVAASEAASSAKPKRYQLEFSAHLDPSSGMADVAVRVVQSAQVLTSLDFKAPASRYTGFEGDGEIEQDGERVLWSVPEAGGRLQFKATINHLRGAVHDARINERWAVLRLDDLFPPARTRAIAGADAEATLSFSGPEGWRFETPYGPSSEKVHKVARDRLFPRPVGWMVAGNIGVRRDSIAGRPVAVAAPVGENFRRQDTLAFLRWTLPALIEVFPTFSERLLIVGSGVDMWRGGLSAPASLYLHPHRPLISGNGTSTLLHELVHVALADINGSGDDWLVEGLAEYYALELLRRTGGISQRRFDGALLKLAQWAEREDAGLAEPSTGADTAYAVLVINDLANRLQSADADMDALIASLLSRGLTAEHLIASLADLGVDATLPELPHPAVEETAE
jgi:hypothetical protein